MRKHLLRIIIAYTCFELFRSLGSELPDLFKGEQTFTWLRDPKLMVLRLSNLFLFLMYPLVSFVIFFKFFHKNKRKAILYFLAAAFCVITSRYLLEEVVYREVFGFHNYYDGVPLLYYYVDNIYYAVVYSAFGILYYFLQNEQRLKVQHHQLQLANKQAQLSFLQSQVNPHFLFNNLNNIYSLVYQNSSKSLQAISGLSDILRYMLYENKETVPLSKELSYIQKYIDLQQLRFKHPVRIEQETEGDTEAVNIPPLVLIPFVENAFKHGDFNHEGIHLKIKLVVGENTIDCFITNNKGNVEKDAAGGIGLQNIRKRLELLYPGRHSLDINDDSNTFTVKLQLIN